MDRCTQCKWWEENGDGSQQICDVCDASDVVGVERSGPSESTTTKRKQRGFISLAKFERKAKLVKPDQIKKWRELELQAIYKVCGVKERLVNINGRRQLSRYGELNDESGRRTNVWLPSLVDTDLKEYAVKSKDIYVRPLGMKNSKTGDRSYHDFVIIEDNDEDESISKQ